MGHAPIIAGDLSVRLELLKRAQEQRERANMAGLLGSADDKLFSTVMRGLSDSDEERGMARQREMIMLMQQRASGIVDRTAAEIFGVSPALSHFGQVKNSRKMFKQYSKEEFRNMSTAPVIKDIMTGSTKLTPEEINIRINEHVDELLKEKLYD